MDISDIKIVELPKILDERGNLSVIEEGERCTF